MNGNGADRRKETVMEADSRVKERRTCGQCRWYDPLCDLCERPGGSCKEPELERWEKKLNDEQGRSD